MRKLLISGVILFGVSGCFFSCKKDKAQQDPSIVSLYNCSDKDAKREPYICFDSLINDSRCPADVVCIWSGCAVIKVSFHESNNIHVFRMSTYFPFSGAINDTTINGYKIQFTALEPYPLVNGPQPTVEDIKATIKISQ